jgi:hypothetical protein
VTPGAVTSKYQQNERDKFPLNCLEEKFTVSFNLFAKMIRNKNILIDFIA